MKEGVLMDWQTAMNQAIDYIEDHLTEDIDYCKLAKIVSCSEWEFRRIFSLVAAIPLSEYIRLRRLTLAAEDIRSGEKIIDVSMKYGYESQSGFSRAFKRFHGVSASSARKEGAQLKFFPALIFKMVVMDEEELKSGYDHRTNIIGAGEVSYAVSIVPDQNNIHSMNGLFWDEKGNDVIGTTSLPQWGGFLSEEKCHLFGDLSGKKVLEIGCGKGQSLVYQHLHGAEELWGIDISKGQIEKAGQNLAFHDAQAKLICASMEEECGIPVNYFDYVYSVYGIGWATDLKETFRKIASYLKAGGTFIFSWSHPIHKCVAYENDNLIFKKSYFDESWYSVNLDGGTFCLADRKLSTYINALSKAGLIIEELVEESDDEMIKACQSDFAKKAKMLPVTFVIKARKNTEKMV